MKKLDWVTGWFGKGQIKDIPEQDNLVYIKVNDSRYVWCRQIDVLHNLTEEGLTSLS